YRDEFLELMRSGTVDIVFANSHEIKSLYQTKSFDEALAAIRKDCKIAAVTRSEKGSVIVRGDETVTIQATTIRELVDTTGAGDLYAAGFLYGYTSGRSLKDCGDLGSLAAGLVIQQIGPRPRQNLRREAERAGLL
ncbi:PfkB family carbohydrate kinase, partial [Mesorhizobium sp. M0843]